MKNKTTALKQKLRQGFTLIELLVVIGILAVLLAIVLIAINPARQFAQANNTQRSSDANAILNAVHQYMIQESAGVAPAAIPLADTDPLTPLSDDALPIGASTASPGTVSDICSLIVPDYIAALPVDPTVTSGPVTEDGCTADHNTGYSIVRNAEGRITVMAPQAQNGVVIEVTR